MKTVLSLFILFLFPVFLSAQNAAPVISNLTVNHTAGTQSVEFAFDVADGDGDPVDLQLRVSADSGRTWLVVLDSIVGDTGYPITPGIGKTITWVYDPADLAGAYPAGVTALQGRIIADDRQGVDVQDLVDQVDSVRVFQRLEFLEGVRNNIANPTRMAAVRDSLEDWMVQSGLQNWHHSWSQFTSNDRNLSGRLPGLLRETRTWMVDGHYDSVNAPGVDDNATGTIGTIEAAAVLGGIHFEQSLRFLCFDLEEQGLIGSGYYVQNEIPLWEDLRGVVNLEMIGYYDDGVNTQSLPAGFDQLFPTAYAAIEADSFRGNFLTNVANVNSNSLKTFFDTCAATYVPDLKVISVAVPGNGQIAPDLRRSDHARFWDAGYPALMITDAADLRNPNYHTAGDTLGTLDRTFLLQNIRAVVATMAKLGNPLHADVAEGTPFEVTVPVGSTAPRGDLRIFPNPTAGAVRMDFDGWAVGAVRVEVGDAQGRILRRWTAEGPAGSLTWDGKDDRGQAVASGSYWVRLASASGDITRRVDVLR